MTIPGISQNVAQSLVAAIGQVDRVDSPEKLASYLGLVPSTRQSASRCYHGGITKAGRCEARWALVQAAQRRTPSLGGVLEKEGLPAPPPLSPGETNMLRETGTFGVYINRCSRRVCVRSGEVKLLAAPGDTSRN